MPAIAEPPVKPSQAPSAPSAPEPKPSTPPSQPKVPTPVPETAIDDDPWQGLDDQIAGKKAEAKTPEKEPDVKVDTKASAGLKSADTKSTTTTTQTSAPKELREQYDRTKAALAVKEEEILKYQARIAEYEAKGKDTTALAERLTQREKELEEAKADARAAKAEMSPDFKEKWDKPFNSAADFAKEEVETLQVGGMVEDPETGTSKWMPQRKADWVEDFAKLYEMSKKSPSAALEQVQSLFGPAASIVLDHLKELKRLDRNRAVAKNEEKAQWKEKETAERAKSVQQEIEQQKQAKEQREAYETGLTKAREGFIEKNPEWYGEDPEDPEGNKLLEEGRQLLKAEPKNFEQAVILATRNRLNAESAPRERYRNRLLREENAQLKATIEEMKKSKPGPGGRSTSTAQSKDTEDSFAGLEEAFNK